MSQNFERQTFGPPTAKSVTLWTMQSGAFQSRPSIQNFNPNLDSLKETVQTEWYKKYTDLIKNTCKSFLNRAEAVFANNGEYVG